MRILFVDDEPHILRALERLMRNRRREWEMRFAEGGAAALRLLQEEPFDVVITDMRMPGIDGYALLTYARERHPQMLRIVLSGYTEREDSLRAAALAHQFLRKPCEPEVLDSAILRIGELKRVIASPDVQAVLAELRGLPSLPHLCHELEERLSRPRVTPRELVALIERDVGMQAKLLQLVNSPLFGLARPVTNLIEAVHLLGQSALRELTLVAKAFQSFEHAPPLANFSLEEFYQHSLLVGSVASALVLDPRQANEAFAAGVMHDVGQLVLAAHMPARLEEDLRRVESTGRSLYEIERARNVADHAALGGALFSLWGLPFPLVEAVARHHDAATDARRDFGVIDAVYLAQRLIDEQETGAPVLTEPLVGYLNRVGALDRLPRWREMTRTRRNMLQNEPERIATWAACP